MVKQAHRSVFLMQRNLGVRILPSVLDRQDSQLEDLYKLREIFSTDDQSQRCSVNSVEKLREEDFQGKIKFHLQMLIFKF